MGLRAINELINQVEPLVHRMREQHFPEAPTVVQCDGIWVTIQGQEEEIKTDKRGRKRASAKREKSGDPGSARLLVRWQTRDPGLADSKQ